MPGTAVIPVPPFAVPQGHHTAPEHGWKERARAGAGDKQLGQAKTGTFLHLQFGEDVSYLPSQSFQRKAWREPTGNPLYINKT